MTLLCAIVSLCVKLLEILQATLMEHVRAVEKSRFLVVYERIGADWAVCVPSFHRLTLDRLPEGIKFLGLLTLVVHCKRSFFLLIECSLDVREEGL